MMRGSLVLLAARAFAAPAVARPASTGFFAEGGLGAVAFLPPDSSDAAVGPAMDLRVGRDLFSLLSLGVVRRRVEPRGDRAAPPEGEWFQLYRGGGDARLGGRSDSVAFFLEGGAGATMMSSNILER